MQTILIIYPHWHPANLAGVQRPRLIGNYLKELGWKPRVLTVKEEYFEEKPDRDFHKIFSNDFEVTRVDALPANKSQKKKTKGFHFLRILYSLLTAHYSIRLIGDIGLRAFFQLYKEAKHIIRTEKIDFIWLPIPSFYNALLGRLLYEKTKVPYGIDYIDPWVRDLSNQKNWRAILSQWVARTLEPIAIKKASVISGVSTPYYAPAIERNFPIFREQLSMTNDQSAGYEKGERRTENGERKKHNPHLSTEDYERKNTNTQLINSSNNQLSNSKLKTQTLNPSTPQLLNPSTPQLLNSSTPQLNPHTSKPFTHVAMPYGFDPNDHKIKLEEIEYPWNNEQLSVSNDQLENGEGNRESKERRAKSEEQRAESVEQKTAQGIDNDSKQLTEVGDGNKLKTHLSKLTSHNSELITPSSSAASAKKNSINQLPNSSNTQPNDLITSYPNDLTTSGSNDLTTSGSNDLHKTWLYAGAFLPNSHVLMDAFFLAIAELRKEGKWDKNIQLWFIGTGPYPAKRITAYAKDHGIEDIVFENRDRYPFLHILNFLSAADTIMVIGSTEKHYTASKTYQSILSERPVVSIFHHESSAVKVMEDCHADQFTVRYKPEMLQEDIVSAFKETLLKRLQTEDWNPDYSALDQYSAKESARKLVKAIESVL